MPKPWTQALLLAAALWLAACGQGPDPNKAQVRLVNASGGYAELDLRVENELRQGRVPYGATASYVEVDPDDTDTTVTSAGSPTPLLSFTPSLSKKKYYTVLAYGEAGALRQALLGEDQGEPESGKALLRVVNGAADAGSLDVYLTGTNDTLQATTPVHGGAVFGSVSGWITVNSANWRLRVTAAGSKTDVRLDLAAVDLPSKGLRTLVLTPGGGGVLVKALLIVQQGGIAQLDNTQARVRLVAGVADRGTVAASVGTQNLTGSASPAVGDYELVQAGASPVVVRANGTLATTASSAIVAGFDYTLLVYGPLAAPAATLLQDDNRLPTDTTRAKLRLVNGLPYGPPASTGSLSMTLDLFPVASGVTVGTASASYTAVTPTSGVGNGALVVGELGVTTPAFTANNQVISAGSVYSFFVLGAQGTDLIGTLRKDR